ncbi:MAG: PilN domain-containing protein [Candidatus Beckwithbacteria bacterium]|nr:PilN domain-containing protein [Candidatus Beckwithbacteria bacterium]
MSARSLELNLLPKEVWEKGTFGQLLTWVLSVGRYIVVFTELVVISAFLYRFGLDRNLTDLRQSLKDKQEIIMSFGDLEDSFRLTQTKLTTIKSVADQPRVLTALDSLSQMIPIDAILTNITINPEAVVIEGQVSSQVGLATLLNQAQTTDQFSDVALDNVQSASDKSGNIEFRMTLTFNQT